MGLKREKLTEPKAPNNYFTSEKPDLKFVPTGCSLLDCALGGGYVLGRMTNIVGDKSTAKTALATEALTNFLMTYPNGAAAYREIESAYDQNYAKAMGLPVEKVDFGDPDAPLLTVEDFARDFDAFLDKQLKAKMPGIYVLDSLDALSDEVEMENDIAKGTFGTAKAKMLSTYFRKTVRKIEQSQVLLLIISQVRDNIGAMFGEKHKRSGGRAMDFYASQIMWLAHIKLLSKVINTVKRPYGVTIKATIKKNKVALPFRSVEFDFEFGFGVNDLLACMEWVNEVGRLDVINMTPAEYKKRLTAIENMNGVEYNKEQKVMSAIVKNLWREIETSFLPTRKKYG